MFLQKLSLPVILAILLALLGACSTTSQTESKASQSPTESTFFDSGIFDQDLSGKLNQNPEKIVIKPSTPLNINSMPERMDKWLSKIKQENGSVQLKEYSETPTKDMSLLMDMAVKLFDLAQDAMMYSPAKQYDAVVEYDKGSGDVKQITLLKKLP